MEYFLTKSRFQVKFSFSKERGRGLSSALKRTQKNETTRDEQRRRHRQKQRTTTTKKRERSLWSDGGGAVHASIAASARSGACFLFSPCFLCAGRSVVEASCYFLVSLVPRAELLARSPLKEATRGGWQRQAAAAAARAPGRIFRPASSRSKPQLEPKANTHFPLAPKKGPHSQQQQQQQQQQRRQQHSAPFYSTRRPPPVAPPQPSCWKPPACDVPSRVDFPLWWPTPRPFQTGHFFCP